MASVEIRGDTNKMQSEKPRFITDKLSTAAKQSSDSVSGAKDEKRDEVTVQ